MEMFSLPLKIQSIGNSSKLLRMLFSTQCQSVCALISLKSSKMLQADRILKNLLPIAQQLQHLLTTKNVTLQLVKGGTQQFNSANLAKRKTATEVKSLAQSNLKDRNILLWAVARITARLWVLVASIRIVRCRLPGRLLVSGQFLGARQQNTSLNTSDGCSLRQSMPE